MKTRKDYMAGNCTHQEYYAQFVTPEIKVSVIRAIGLKKLMASTDPHLNDIPLERWDDISTNAGAKMKEAGDFLSMAGNVCIAKAAARQIIEQEVK